ncbi:hypothetical protein LSCM4_02307 [Leishmania orientalis]|uniref:Uncharacterized protein n=1 Tax=Leishmania orientalis TaxID=2249476 RepID=A0A836GNP3_9TRYP|nr:hypothetical protein LSCM4_02307 [Leishmania orientalis]
MIQTARILLRTRPPLLLADTQTAITDAHVVYQLVDFAYSLGLVSPTWMSYEFSLVSRLKLRRGTVPVNVWHTMCNRTFFEAYATHALSKIDRSELQKAAPLPVIQFTLKQDQAQQLKWEPACPSVALCFRSPARRSHMHQLWVLTELASKIPVKVSARVETPPFATFVHVEQLCPDENLSRLLLKAWGGKKCP